MAIKILGTIVVDDSRNLTNIAGMTGVKYSDTHPVVTDLGTGTTEVLDFNNPAHDKVLTAATSFTESNKAKGKATVLLLDTSVSDYNPSFSANVVWPAATAPTWADFRYWIVTFTCLDTVNVLAGAVGYDI